MLYNVYQKFSFTPEDVEKQIVSQEDLLKKFVNDLFSNLKDVLNAEVLDEEKYAEAIAKLFVADYFINQDNIIIPQIWSKINRKISILLFYIIFFNEIEHKK